MANLHSFAVTLGPDGDSIILLSEVVAKTKTITIACRGCDRSELRAGWPLLAQHGPHLPMSDLLLLLGAGCPRRDNNQITDRCDVHYPDLSGWVNRTGDWIWLATCRYRR